MAFLISLLEFLLLKDWARGSVTLQLYIIFFSIFFKATTVL